jgi:hypothetical protein
VGRGSRATSKARATVAKLGGLQKIPRASYDLETFLRTKHIDSPFNTNSHHHTAKMPKSKRSKVVHLSKTEKKGKELSQKLFANVQEAADTFAYIFVFSVENMRNSYLKEVRQEFSDSR